MRRPSTSPASTASTGPIDPEVIRADFVLRHAGQLATMQPTDADPLGRVTDGALAARQGRVVWIGPDRQLERGVELDGDQVDAAGACVMPGLVDAHTHLVIGWRRRRADPTLRLLNAWGWKQLVSFIFGIHVRDIDCAFKLFRAEFFRTQRLETRGAMINVEIIYKLARAGYTYTEVGVQHLPRRAGKATGAKPAVILRAIRELFLYAEKWRHEEQQTLYI